MLERCKAELTQAAVRAGARGVGRPVQARAHPCSPLSYFDRRASPTSRCTPNPRRALLQRLLALPVWTSSYLRRPQAVTAALIPLAQVACVQSSHDVGRTLIEASQKASTRPRLGPRCAWGWGPDQ